jgi:hypothetical protein
VAEPDPVELPKVLDLASRGAARYLDAIADRPVRGPQTEDVAASFRSDLPDDGVAAERVPGTRYMLMAGKPYGETPVFNGPFVD